MSQQLPYLLAPTYIKAALRLTGHIYPQRITADVHNFYPSGWRSCIVCHLKADANWAITGFEAGKDGELKILVNDDTATTIFILINAAGSNSNNQVDAHTDYIILPPKAAIPLMYFNGTIKKWRPVTPVSQLVGPGAYVVPSTDANGLLGTAWLASGAADATVYLRGDQTWSPTYSIEWTQSVTKASDQSVTNSATLVDDSALQLSVNSGEVWYFEAFILYSANSVAADFKFDAAVSSGTFTGWHGFQGDSTTADAINVSTGVRDAAVANWAAAVACGTDAADTPRTIFVNGMLRFSATGMFKLRFAQNTATASTTSKMRTGTILRGRKLA